MYSCDTLANAEENSESKHFSSDILNTMTDPGVPNHRLTLKVGALCILIRNLSFDDGLVNGTKVVIKKISKFLIDVEIANSNNLDRHKVLSIPRISFKFIVGKNGIEILRRQFPLKLAYGLTINKSQGQTLNKVGLDLREDVFAHGQLYVALGRVKKSEDIKILLPISKIIKNEGRCLNVIYKPLLE